MKFLLPSVEVQMSHDFFPDDEPRVGVLICVLQFSKEKNTTQMVKKVTVGRSACAANVLWMNIDGPGW